MQESNKEKYRFLLFIAEGQTNSTLAKTNVESFLEKHLRYRHELSIIDVTKDPHIALENGIYFTPMLIKVAPLPETYLAGDMSDEQMMKQTIGIPY